MSNTEELTIRRRCAGYCGTLIEYVLEPDPGAFAPELLCRDALISYKGGHLCRACASAVEDALAARRAACASQDDN
jgi:hypothetical protein